MEKQIRGKMKEVYNKLKDMDNGDKVVINLFDAEVHKINDFYIIFELPLASAYPRFAKATKMLPEAVALITSWT